ncbi:MAG: substrate-binding domain-containing protein [Alphaproteobacteria bacterium]|nr:substrate-binding domain-containing protein [Alphaproteobacteria bacterium]
MALSRRAFGLGLLGASVAGTGTYFAIKDRPEFQGLIGNRTELFGFLGGEKQAFIEDADVVRALGNHGLGLDARVAGSVEMSREPALLGQNPQFLWPSSSVMVDIARASGVKVRRDQVVLNSPIVVYSWEPVVAGLTKAGLVTATMSGHYELDLLALLSAVLAGTDWSELGVDVLYGRSRLVSTDPNRSNSGFMFAGLVLNLLSGDVADMEALDVVGEKARDIFAGMGLKSSSSGKLFDQYLAGGYGAEPMVVGYENQLVEWILADPERWQRIAKSTQPKPVMLYPRPTAYSAHPLITIAEAADRLLEALLSEPVQQLAWMKHGFRGPLGAVSGSADPAIAGLLPDGIGAVLPMPAANVMLAFLSRLAA